MSPREIRIYGDPVLGTRAEEVTTFDAGLRTLAGDMLETMDNAGAVSYTHLTLPTNREAYT